MSTLLPSLPHRLKRILLAPCMVCLLLNACKPEPPQSTKPETAKSSAPMVEDTACWPTPHDINTHRCYSYEKRPIESRWPYPETYEFCGLHDHLLVYNEPSAKAGAPAHYEVFAWNGKGWEKSSNSHIFQVNSGDLEEKLNRELSEKLKQRRRQSGAPECYDGLETRHYKLDEMEIYYEQLAKLRFTVRLPFPDHCDIYKNAISHSMLLNDLTPYFPKRLPAK